eukprot:1385404-Amorphochlora_amoeboformis.AAC.1
MSLWSIFGRAEDPTINVHWEGDKSLVNHKSVIGVEGMRFHPSVRNKHSHVSQPIFPRKKCVLFYSISCTQIRTLNLTGILLSPSQIPTTTPQKHAKALLKNLKTIRDRFANYAHQVVLMAEASDQLAECLTQFYGCDFLGLDMCI